MTGLNLESFLHLLRADVGIWTTVGLIAFLLALMTWTSWGARRALRKCLVLSVASHLALVFYGSTLPQSILGSDSTDPWEDPRDRIREIRVTPWSEGLNRPGTRPSAGGAGSLREALEQTSDRLALNESKVSPDRPDLVAPDTTAPSLPDAPAPTIPEVQPNTQPAPEPAPATAPPASEAIAMAPVAQAAPTASDEVAAPVVVSRAEPGPPAESSPLDQLSARQEAARLRTGPVESGITRPGTLGLTAPESAPALAMVAPAFGPSNPAPPPLEPVRPGARSSAPSEVGPKGSEANKVAGDPTSSGVARGVVQRRQEPPPVAEPPATDVRQLLRAQRPLTDPTQGIRSMADVVGPLALSRTTPRGLPQLPEIKGARGGRPLSDVPEVYRSRLDPNRTTLAQKAGATAESEQAVERALAWLAKHQDADGRWDAGIARHDDGTPLRGDDDFTVHCPPGEPCSGECLYWEADTALTGLSLLAFLGSGYTHTDGKYAETIARGLGFLRSTQKPDGDLRGDSRSVGMYCHAMAALALCESYALTGDTQLRDPVERAVGFLIRGRARDGLAWRYLPGAPTGDTSILGWVVLALKSARVSGISLPDSIQTGTLGWLGKVASGPERGLASYQPGQPPTPTMTAEAWVCRQFLGVGGPGPMSNEAARYLIEHGPNKPGRDAYNLYYWYYGTLAMYQHGGESWTRWNEQVRDQIVKRQQRTGHRTGSWDPDDSIYGERGGRIYSTALAALTLEVYYRFLRMYDGPAEPESPTGRVTRNPVSDRDPSS